MSESTILPAELVTSPVRFAGRTTGGFAGLAAGTARREIAVWWAGSRLFVLVFAALAQTIGWPHARWHPSLIHHPFVILGSWDAQWYRIVAGTGYLLIPGHFSDPAFFPLLPVVEHAFSLAGIPPIVSGVVVANLAFLVGLLAAYEVGKQLLPEPDARRAAVYLAIFPYSFVFSMAYPEGLAFAFVALTGLFALRGQWIGAGIAVAAVTLARPQGVFLALPIAVLAWRSWGAMPERSRVRAVAAVLSGPAALLSFSAYLWHTVGNPMAWSKAEVAWGRSFSVIGVYRAVDQLIQAPALHDWWLFRDAAFCVAYIALLVLARQAGIPWSWVLCGAGMVLLPLASGTFTSDGRFGLLALPVFWGLAVLGRRPWANRLVLVLSPILLAVAVLTIRARYP